MSFQSAPHRHWCVAITTVLYEMRWSKRI